MKKFLSIITLTGFAVILALPMMVSAQPPAQISECCVLKVSVTSGANSYSAGDIVGAPNGYCAYGTITKPTIEWGSICLMSTIGNATNWVFYIFSALAVIFIVIGGITMMTAAGDPEKFKTGRLYVLYAVIGVVIGLLAKALPAILRGIIGL